MNTQSEISVRQDQAFLRIGGTRFGLGGPDGKHNMGYMAGRNNAGEKIVYQRGALTFAPLTQTSCPVEHSL